MKTLILTDGCKGGVGKSTVASSLYEALLHDARQTVLGFDTDAGQFSRLYDGAVTAVDLHGDMARVIDDLLAAPAGASALVDVGAQMSVTMQDWIMSCGPADAAREGRVRIINLFVIGSAQCSVDFLTRALDTWSGFPFELHAVRNWGVADSFLAFDQSDLPERLRLTGSLVMDFPALPNAVYAHRDHLSLPIGHYVTAPSARDRRGALATIGYSDRMTTKHWQERAVEAFRTLPSLERLWRQDMALSSSGHGDVRDFPRSPASSRAVA